MALITYKSSKTFPLVILGEGSFFGEIELLMKCSRQFSVMTVTDCVILMLEKSKFITIFYKKYPRLGSSLENFATWKWHSLKKVADTINEFMIAANFKNSQSKLLFFSIIN